MAELENPDLGMAFAALDGKRVKYDRLWDYYDGNQPLRYSSERLRELFNDLSVRFVENWCAVVVNAIHNRVDLLRFEVGTSEGADSKAATALLNDLYKQTELDLEAIDIHLATLVCGEAFLIVWKEGDDGEIQSFYHDPRLCHVEYDAENPHKKVWAAKWWEEVLEDGENHIRINLFYPDRVEYWASTKKAKSTKKAADFVRYDPAGGEQTEGPNPWNQVPVFHFRRERRVIKGEIEDIQSLQDAVNKLLADMMVNSEFSAMMQRYVVTNADLDTIKQAPNEHWVIPAGTGDTEDTQVGQFTQGSPDSFLKAMDSLAAAIGTISQTPKHYFIDQTGDPSGEALIVHEAPLNKKTARFIQRSSNVWQRVMSLMALMAGAVIDPEDITPIYDAPETVQPKTEAEIRKINTEAGMPLKTVLRKEGWSDAELKEMEKDQKADSDRTASSLASAMAERQLEFDQGQRQEPGGEPNAVQERETA